MFLQERNISIKNISWQKMLKLISNLLVTVRKCKLLTDIKLTHFKDLDR